VSENNLNQTIAAIRANNPFADAVRQAAASDLEAITAKWLRQCGSCDAGLPEFGCTCPEGDPRVVISQLVIEVERLRGEAEAYEEAIGDLNHRVVRALKDAAHQRERAEAAEARIAAALELHRNVATDCVHCTSLDQGGRSGWSWPCETVKALTGDSQTGETATRPDSPGNGPESPQDARTGVGADEETPEAQRPVQEAVGICGVRHANDGGTCSGCGREWPCATFIAFGPEGGDRAEG
jgi:hypothetical protein